MTITADYSPAPGEAPENLSANEFRAASDLNLTCVVDGASGSLSYSWSLEESGDPVGCDTCGRPVSLEPNTLFLSPVYPEYAGSYICSVSESGMSGSVSSDPFPVRIIGMPILAYLFHQQPIIILSLYDI